MLQQLINILTGNKRFLVCFTGTNIIEGYEDKVNNLIVYEKSEKDVEIFLRSTFVEYHLIKVTYIKRIKYFSAIC